MTSQTLLNLIQSLPGLYESLVETYIRNLLSDSNERRKRKLRQSWAGGLAEVPENISSVTLQKKILDWWTG